MFQGEGSEVSSSGSSVDPQAASQRLTALTRYVTPLGFFCLTCYILATSNFILVFTYETTVIF